jgi:integrase
MPVHKITASKFAQLLRSTRRGLIGDGGNLYLQLSGTPGSASWLFRYVDKGRRSRVVGLGPVHTVSIAAAREAARQLREAKFAGRDIRAARNAARAANGVSLMPTFEKVMLEFLGPNHEQDFRGWHSQLTRHALPAFGTVPIDQITTAMMEPLFKKLERFQPNTSRKLRYKVREIFDFAIHSRSYVTGANPAGEGLAFALKNIQPDQSALVEHMSAMPWESVPDFMPRLGKLPELAARALEFCILTNCRTGDITGQAKADRAAKPPLLWSHIDFAERTWTIPANKTSARKGYKPKPFRIPLSPQAMAVLETVRAMGLPGEIVFPSMRKASAAMSHNAMRILLGSMEPDCHVHGFRGSFKTWATNTKAESRDIIEMCMAHEVRGEDAVESVYIADDILARRAALMAAWGNYLMPRPALHIAA